MSLAFTKNEIKYLTAWAIEDHLGQVNGRARTLQREHNVRPVVLGHLFATWCGDTGQNQMDIVDAAYPQGAINWPWSSEVDLEKRLKALLPASALDYLEKLGALALQKAPS